MSSRKDHENMIDLDSCYKLVQQSSTKGGIRAVDIATKLRAHKTTVYHYLNSLRLMGKVESEQGLWRTTTGEQTIMPLEKEIVIELPIPEKKFPDIARLQILADSMKDSGLSMSAGMIETIIETFNKTRTIKIKGKNVDDLDLEKIAVMIQQANEKNSKVNMKGMLKRLKL
jgi:hypothetical protein